MKISVIIPCYNEEDSILKVIKSVHESLNRYEYEIILVDDGSTDNTKVLLDEYLRSDGIGRDFLKIEAGGSILPASEETVKNKQHFVYQDGKTVFKFAVSNMADVTEKIMTRNNLTKEDVQWLVPHQANKRIIDATANRAELDPSKVMVNIQKYGNTTSATLPLLLNDYEKQLKKGDNLIFAAFGGGFTWGSIYLKWAYNAKQ